AGRMDAANVAGQDQEIYRTDERPQVRSETEGTGFAPGVRLIGLPDFDMRVAEIPVLVSLSLTGRRRIAGGHTVSGDSPLSMHDKPSLDGSNPEARMSALGQKRTFPHVHTMPLYPRKRTSTQTANASSSKNRHHLSEPTSMRATTAWLPPHDF